MSEKKIALVTGAATGIGKACALSLAKAGFTIALNYRSKEKEAAACLQELAGDGHQLFKADIADKAQAQALVANTVAAFKRIDVLVNAAGAFTNQDIFSEDYSAWTDSWEKSLRVNLLAPVNLAHLVAQAMLAQKRGKIINITSRGAFRGEPTAPAYGASKSALNSASQSLAVALAPHGICVYAIAPGWTETPAASPRINGDNAKEIRAGIPLGRVGKPSEIGNLVAFLAGEETDYLTGAIFDANGASYLRN